MRSSVANASASRVLAAADSTRRRQDGGQLCGIARQLATDSGGLAGRRLGRKRHHQRSHAITKHFGWKSFVGEQCVQIRHQATVAAQLMILPILNARARTAPEVGDTMVQQVEPAVGQPEQLKPKEAGDLQHAARRTHVDQGSGLPVEHRTGVAPQPGKRQAEREPVGTHVEVLT